MEDSIFTKIIKGKIPGQVIYEDETVAALLTIEPLSEGHLLVVPKAEVDHLWDVESETYHHMWDVARDMAALLKEKYPHYQRIGVVVEGFGVPHAHIHVFGYEQPLNETIIRHVETDHRQHTTPAHLAEVAARLRGQ